MSTHRPPIGRTRPPCGSITLTHPSYVLDDPEERLGLLTVLASLKRMLGEATSRRAYRPRGVKPYAYDARPRSTARCAYRASRRVEDYVVSRIRLH